MFTSWQYDNHHTTESTITHPPHQFSLVIKLSIKGHFDKNISGAALRRILMMKTDKLSRPLLHGARKSVESLSYPNLYYGNTKYIQSWTATRFGVSHLYQILVPSVCRYLHSCVFAECPSRSRSLCWWPATVSSSRAPELWSTLWWYLAMWPLSADNTRYGQLRNSTFAISLSVSTHWALKDRWPVILPSPRTSTSCIPDPAPGTRLPGCPACYLTLQISSAQNTLQFMWIFHSFWLNETHVMLR